jgi:hypothetical protein
MTTLPTDPPEKPVTENNPKTPADPQHHKEEIKFLSGPQTRGFELRLAIDIFLEFIRGFRKLHFVGPCVTVFGSARFKEDHPYYMLTREVGQKLAREGFTVMTGAGPGIMEAANRGAKDVGGRSVGANIYLPHEQKENDYLDTVVTFKHFFIRKTMLIKYSYAFIAMPGGFGTFDEIFETLTLIQTGKINDFPMVLIGVDFWRPLMEGVIRDRLLKEATISPKDIDLLFVTDSPDEAVAYIKHMALERFGLTYGPVMKKSWWLWE